MYVCMYVRAYNMYVCMYSYIHIVTGTYVGQVTCGLPEPGNHVDAAIIGGEVTEPDVWPWQLSVEEDDGFSRTLVCGGAIIGPNWGVTAAQCVSNKT